MGLDDLKNLQFQQFETFHLKQANHNYIFCYNIFNSSVNNPNSEKQFFDWVITSAFYSALHYIRCALSIDKSFMFYSIHFENKTIEEARRHRMNNPQSYPSDAAVGRHEIIKRIVQDSYPVVSVDYNILLDCSKTSRYCQYKNATCDDCKESLDFLDSIRDWFSAKSSIVLPVYANL